MSKDAEAIDEFVDCKIDEELSTLYTSFPATVIEYADQLAKVKPVMNGLFADGDVVEFAPLSNVPVIFPSGGGAIMSFPIKVGDPIWIQCSSASFNKFKESYQTNASDDMRRRHSINDAVAFPCIYPKDIRLGVNNENVEIIFNSLNEDRSINEFLSGIKMLPDGSLNITTKNAHNIELREDKSFVIENTETKTKWEARDDKSFILENTESGASFEALDNGNLEITTANTIKLQNSNEELVNLSSELMQLLIDALVNTSIGPQPLTNKAQIIALKSRLDTLKG